MKATLLLTTKQTDRTNIVHIELHALIIRFHPKILLHHHVKLYF